jgi:uncharacterized membrane protein HdeD (DUF308 family)
MDPLLIAIKLLGITLIVGGVFRLANPSWVIKWESSRVGTLVVGIVLLLTGALLLLVVKQSNIPS